MCYFSSREEKLLKEIEPNTFEKIASDLFKKTQVLYLSCYSEPLCSKHILHYVSTAKRYNIPFVSFTTNGMLLDKTNMSKFIELGIDEIIISITGGQQSTYEYYHTGASWNTLWKNIDDLYNMKRSCKALRPKIWLNYILTRKSIHEIKLIIPLIKKYEITGITLRELIYFPKSDPDFYEENRLSKENAADIIAIKNLLKSEGISIIESIQCTRSKKNIISKKYPCISPFFQFHINSKGMLKFCIFHKWQYDLNNDSFEDIKNKPEMKSFLKKLKKKETCDCVTTCPNHGSNEAL
jgi:MoaA/NifB/PqqE/SkfB family radical SAM enzyme